MLTPAQIQQRRNAGLALKEQRGQEYFQRIGKKGGDKGGHLGGRPTFQQAIERAQARLLAAQAASRPGRKSRKEVASL